MEIKRNDYTEEFNRVAMRLGEVFPSESGYQNMQKYLRGLLGSSERKNGWQMSEYLGATTPTRCNSFCIGEDLAQMNCGTN